MSLIIRLPDEEIKALAAKAQARRISAEQYARRVLEHDLGAATPPRRRHISEVIRDNMRRVPMEILAVAKAPKLIFEMLRPLPTITVLSSVGDTVRRQLGKLRQ
jgi:hypothetical protein